MDVVLEVFDTYLFDHIYAALLPVHSSALSSFDPISTLTANLGGSGGNTTGLWGEGNGGVMGKKSMWEFAPASQYFSVLPGEAAWMSRWDRDNAWRQAASLYIITW